MKNFGDHITRLAEWISYGLELVLVALIVVTLTEWWGMSWVITVLMPLVLFIVLFSIVYRFVGGKWPKFYATALGSLAGRAGLMLIFPGLLIFAIVYRFVEGGWPLTYLCLWAVLVVLRLVQEFLQRETADT